MKKIIGAVGIRTIKAHRNCPHAGYSKPVVHVSLPGYLELNGFYKTKNTIPSSVLLITELHAAALFTALHATISRLNNLKSASQHHQMDDTR